MADRLGEEHRRAGTRPLLVLDGVDASAEAPELSRLLAAIGRRRCCQVLVVGPPGVCRDLAGPASGTGGAEPREIVVPPLDHEQVAQYVTSWIEASRAGERSPILLTPDATLLLRLRSRGVAGRIGVLAENMLLLAAAEGRRTLSSWHAWAASARERWGDTRGDGALPRRPPDWPTPDVVAVIDACRRDAGMPPWPRGETRRP
jgi:type II secretory pathway predicted ATPase ExeA